MIWDITEIEQCVSLNSSNHEIHQRIIYTGYTMLATRKNLFLMNSFCERGYNHKQAYRVPCGRLTMHFFCLDITPADHVTDTQT